MNIISIILPTYNEVDNISTIIPKINEIFNRDGINGEIIVIDDNSPDGTASVAKDLSKKYPVRVFIRKTDRGLSKSVIKGLELAQGEICLVMDADLSHPVEKISEMITPLILGTCDITVASRKIPGGGSVGWPFYRHIISQVAGFLARGVTNLSDPTSGFMGLRKSILENTTIDPFGWKIVLEIVVKTKSRIEEIPIVFYDRKFGKSKFGSRAFVEYLYHLWKLYLFKYFRHG